VVAILYADPRLKLPLVILAISLLFQTLSMVPRTIATRDLDFRRAAVPDSVGKASGAVVSIGLAVLGLAYWSPVYGTLAGAILGAMLQLAATRWRPRLSFSPGLAREIVQFGRFVTFSSLANFVAHSVDNAIVGLVLGVAPLGFYVFAYSWSVYMTSNLTSIISSVAYPVMSKVVDDPVRLRRIFSENIRYYGYVAFLLSGALSIFSPTFVAIVYGPVWAPAGVTMQVLAPVGLLLGYAGIAADALYAIGRSRTVSIFSWIEVGVILTLVPPATIFGGIVGTSLAALAGSAVVATGLTISVSHITGLGRREFWRSTRHSFLAMIVTLALTLPAVLLVPATPVIFVLVACVYVSIYFASLHLITSRGLVPELRALFRMALTRATGQ
jgi:PST family polysaccharide transporter/lipopolysaccharide exporter